MKRPRIECPASVSRAGIGEAEPWVIQGRNLSATDLASMGELVEQNQSLQEPLAHDQPLCWVRVTTAEQHRQWNELINQYHYLGAPGLVGAQYGVGDVE